MKIKLYWDNIKRFKFKQLYYLFINKSARKIIQTFFKPSVSKEYNLKDISYPEFKNQLNKLFTFKNFHEPIRKSGENYDRSLNPFYNKLLFEMKKNFKDGNLDIESFLCMELEGLEEEFNKARFYLYTEALTDFSVPDKEKIKLMLHFINDFKYEEKTWSGFNTSLRLFNWFKLLYSMSEKFSLNDSDWNIIQRAIRIHAYHIKKNIEYHIPSNHIFIQYYILWTVGIIFNDDEILKFSEKSLTEETKKQFLKSGFHFELSYHYHIQITLFLMLWIYGSSKFNRKIEESIISIAKKATYLVNDFKLPDGSLPMIGDNCYTFVHSNLYADVDKINDIFNSIFPGESFKSSDKIINVDGEYIISKNRNSQLIFDVGKICISENPGHGHSDLLNIIYFDQIPLFIDPGTRRYSNSNEDMLLKKTSSHNTVTIDNSDQAILWRFFRWSYLPTPVGYEIEKNENFTKITAEFKGFMNLGGMNHRRTVTQFEDKLQIEDFIYGKGFHNIELNFVLSPLVKAEILENNVLLKHQDQSWLMQIIPELDLNISTNSFTIYPYYDSPINTSKISFLYPNRKFPFSSKTTLLKSNNYYG